MEEKNPVGRPRLYETPEQLEAAIEDYFNPEVIEETQTGFGKLTRELGRQTRQDSTITGLAYHLGFESRQSFYDYETIPEFSYIIKRARLRVESSYEARLSANNVAGAIFALKNMGWADKSEMDVTSKGEQINGFNYIPPAPTEVKEE